MVNHSHSVYYSAISLLINESTKSPLFVNYAPALGTKDVILWHPFSFEYAPECRRTPFLSLLKKAQKDRERPKCFSNVSVKC